jgi:hypothetical protein
MFWIIVLAVVVVLSAAAWWLSGPRFCQPGRGIKPPGWDTNNPVHKHGGGGGGGGAGA